LLVQGQLRLGQWPHPLCLLESMLLLAAIYLQPRINAQEHSHFASNAANYANLGTKERLDVPSL